MLIFRCARIWRRKPLPQPSFSETPSPQGFTAPASIESESSGTTRSGSISKRVPRPLQSPHMPCGLLKEKAWGVSSGKEIWHFPHAAVSEKVSSSSPGTEAISWPSPIRRAVSTDSVRRETRPDFRTSRSITASTSMLLALVERLEGPSVSRISPSTRRRSPAGATSFLDQLAMFPLAVDQQRVRARAVVVPVLRVARVVARSARRSGFSHAIPAEVTELLLAGARPEHAQVVGDLGNRPNGGARVVARRLLLDRDRR